MKGRRRGLFRGRRSGFSANPKKPISNASKIIYALSICSMLILASALYYVVYTKGESGKIFGGVGFLCMYFGLIMTVFSISRVRRDFEPLPARVLAVALSAIAFVAWGGVYLVGTIRG